LKKLEKKRVFLNGCLILNDRKTKIFCLKLKKQDLEQRDGCTFLNSLFRLNKIGRAEKKIDFELSPPSTLKRHFSS